MRYSHYSEIYKKRSIAKKIRYWLYKSLVGDIASALEFGIGHGYFRDFCKDNGIEYTGVDSCKQLSTDDTIIANIPDEISLVPSGYDLIFAEHFIEHMDGYKSVMGFLDGCRVRLNKGGEIILLYPNMNKHFWHDPTHQYPTNKKRIEKCLIDAGFSIIESDDYAHCLVGFFDTILFRIIGYVMPANWRISLHFCVHSYTHGVISMDDGGIK